MNETELELHQAREKLTKTTTENNILRGTLNLAVNELCNRCGRFRYDYLGACDHCKWRPVRNGELPV